MKFLEAVVYYRTFHWRASEKDLTIKFRVKNKLRIKAEAEAAVAEACWSTVDHAKGVWPITKIEVFERTKIHLKTLTFEGHNVQTTFHQGQS